MVSSYIFFVVYIVFNAICASVSAETSWNYADLGPDTWPFDHPDCSKESQSPIDIKTACTYYENYPSFQFSSTYNMVQDFTVTNDGHAITGTQVNATAFPLILTGGGLIGNYTFVNFHLHWGENYASGSEHQLNGQKYSGEIHVVHRNATGALAVLGVFIDSKPSNSNSSDHHRRKRETKREVSNMDNATLDAWDKYMDLGDDLNQTDTKTVISLALMDLMGDGLDKFYRYSGSLTVPPCTQNVTWTVFEKPLVFSVDELQDFRTYLFPKTFREPQLLNGRTVYRNFANATRTNIPDYQCCMDKPIINPDTHSSTSSIYRKSISITNIPIFIYSTLLIVVSFLLI